MLYMVTSADASHAPGGCISRSGEVLGDRICRWDKREGVVWSRAVRRSTVFKVSLARRCSTRCTRQTQQSLCIVAMRADFMHTIITCASCISTEVSRHRGPADSQGRRGGGTLDIFRQCPIHADDTRVTIAPSMQMILGSPSI